MTPRALAIVVGTAIVVGVLASLVLVGLVKRYGAPPTNAAAAVSPAPPPATPGRKIKARLFYVADDGARLVSVEREVPFGEGTVEQARQIIEAQIAPAPEPRISAVPQGTVLRTIFMTEGGEAFVDLSGEVVTGHSGGSTNEALTVYTLVNALTENLPAVTAVQLLVNGKEVDTLAGHLDLRGPLERSPTWVQ